MSPRSPVLILAYGRSKNTIKTIDLLLTAKVPAIFIYLDAPKSFQVTENQKQILKYVSEVSTSTDIEFQVRRNTRNQGVAVSMISALDWFFSKVEFGIVLEDDLTFNTDFLNWCDWSRDRFSARSEVTLVSGNRYIFAEETLPSITCSRYPQTWGWATWQDRWLMFRNQLEQVQLGFSNLYSRRLNFWAGGAMRVISGKTDTWDLLMAFYMYRGRKLCILPPVNLVSNIGVDEFATHTKIEEFPIGFAVKPLRTYHLEMVESELHSNKLVDRELERKIFKMKKRHFLSPIKNFLHYFFGNKLSDRLRAVQAEDVSFL